MQCEIFICHQHIQYLMVIEEVQDDSNNFNVLQSMQDAFPRRFAVKIPSYNQ